MLEYLECDELMGGVGDRECCTSSGLTRIPSFRRKLSEVGTASTAAAIDQATSSTLAASIKPNKPCLKRRSSAPPPQQEMSSALSLRQCRGSCDSLGGSSVDFEDADSSIGIGSSRSSGSDVGSFSSRKSVSFADSVGEDLCHIKVGQLDI